MGLFEFLAFHYFLVTYVKRRLKMLCFIFFSFNIFVRYLVLFKDAKLFSQISLMGPYGSFTVKALYSDWVDMKDLGVM